jgi:RHS repeat-associated protein
LLSETARGSTLQRTYDDATGVVKKVWPDGRAEEHVHDLNGALSRVVQTSASAIGGPNGTMVDFLRSGPALIGKSSFGSASSVTNAFDDRKRLTSTALTAPGGSQTVAYRYDSANQRRVEHISGANPKLSVFEFDARHRLIEAKDGFVAVLAPAKTQSQHDAAIVAAAAAASGAAHREAFEYDQADARTKYSETGNPDKIYSYQPGHRLVSDGTLSYSHNPDGTARSAGPVTYDADAFGRVIAVRRAGATVCEIEYDALSRPVVVQQTGRPVRAFRYAGDFVEQEDDGATVAAHVTLDSDSGVPIARHTPAQRHYPMFDGRYNLVALTDESGSIRETYRYQPFGAPRIFNAAGTAIPLSAFGVDPVFGGQRYLSSPGLYLSKRRVMDPSNGRFLSSDPNAYGDSPSLYVYAAQNPIDLIDPDGSWAVVGVLVVMGIGALVAGGINAGRQGVQILEGSKPKGFSGWELLEAILIGSVIAPALVFAPEAAVPLALAGVASGVNELKQGHIATGMYDIITALLPFVSKGGRASTFGEGSLFSGLSKGASYDTRVTRFSAVEKGIGNMAPDPFGRDIGLGLVRPRTPEGMGHAAVVVENAEGKLAFFEKNAQPDEHDFLVSDFNSEPAPPDRYFNGHALLPFEYRTLRISKANAQRALGYAQERTSRVEPFDKRCANCANFASDVLGEAGFREFGGYRPMKVWMDLINFDIARRMTYSARAPVHPNDLVGSK